MSIVIYGLEDFLFQKGRVAEVIHYKQLRRKPGVRCHQAVLVRKSFQSANPSSHQEPPGHPPQGPSALHPGPWVQGPNQDDDGNQVPIL